MGGPFHCEICEGRGGPFHCEICEVVLSTMKSVRGGVVLSTVKSQGMGGMVLCCSTISCLLVHCAVLLEERFLQGQVTSPFL